MGLCEENPPGAPSPPLHGALERPVRLAYNCSGLNGVDHLLQCLQVWVIVGKLFFLVVEMASSLKS